ncbi:MULTISPECIES: hypothetical protein [unclassified Isoptericola]|uniref:hypothetical protein n=1 Tax=unclassified Isoptericola TaxID=2623355 RepID=UPI0036492BF4
MTISRLGARSFLAVLTVCAFLLSGVVAAQPASAWTSYSVKVTGRSTGIVNMNNMLAMCSGTPGTRCSIEKSVSATRTIGLSLGASRSFVAGELNVSKASTRTVSVSCSAKLTSTRRTLRAYPIGTQVFYKITKNVNGKKTTSGTLAAFVPSGSSTFCTLVRG